MGESYDLKGIGTIVKSKEKNQVGMGLVKLNYSKFSEL